MNLLNQPPRQRLPAPIRDRGHIGRVKDCYCLNCGARPCEAHHVRVGAYQLGKRQCDSRTVPLCKTCHADLHSGNEREWWDEREMDGLYQAAQTWRWSTGNWPEWYDA